MNLSLVNALLLIFALLFAWAMYRFNKASNNDYNIVDILMGPNKRASLTNHILLGMALMSVWVVIDREMDGRDDVTTLLLGVLGIFVLQKTATAVTDIVYKPTEQNPNPEGDQSQGATDGNGIQTVTTQTKKSKKGSGASTAGSKKSQIG